ncbi:MAG: SH3 domain-containing protein [Treponema sp.]|nr:SH3 domain-containing protein [Treponema sp.]
MKRLILCTALSLFAAGALCAQSLVGRTMYVTAKTIEVKSSTAFFADVLGTLSYGAPVSVLQEYGKWVQIKSSEPPGLSGWVAAASLTSKRIIVGSSTSASANEIALAGKGFNQEVENAYRQNGTLNYEAIDAMEAIRIPSRQIFSFLQEGRLARGE